MSYLENGDLPSSMREAKRLTVLAQNFEILGGVLYHMWYPDNLGKHGRIVLQLVLPHTLLHDTLTSAHRDIPAGHYGIKKTYHTIKLNSSGKA